MSATAFHSVDPTRRYELAAAALRPTGALPLIRNYHVAAPESDAYYRGVLRIYEAFAPEVVHEFAQPASEIPGFAAEVEASRWFKVLGEVRTEWSQFYSAGDLVGLLRTYSDHRALPRRRRAALLREIGRFVSTELRGGFVDRYMTDVCVATPLSAGAGRGSH